MLLWELSWHHQLIGIFNTGHFVVLGHLWKVGAGTLGLCRQQDVESQNAILVRGFRWYGKACVGIGTENVAADKDNAMRGQCRVGLLQLQPVVWTLENT